MNVVLHGVEGRDPSSKGSARGKNVNGAFRFPA